MLDTASKIEAGIFDIDNNANITLDKVQEYYFTGPKERRSGDSHMAAHPTSWGLRRDKKFYESAKHWQRMSAKADKPCLKLYYNKQRLKDTRLQNNIKCHLSAHADQANLYYNLGLYPRALHHAEKANEAKEHNDQIAKIKQALRRHVVLGLDFSDDIEH